MSEIAFLHAELHFANTISHSVEFEEVSQFASLQREQLIRPPQVGVSA